MNEQYPEKILKLIIDLKEENDNLRATNNNYVLSIKELAAAVGYNDNNIKISTLKEKILNIIKKNQETTKKTKPKTKSKR